MFTKAITRKPCKALIETLGYPVKLVDTSEFRKIDGSLTCLSLRF